MALFTPAIVDEHVAKANTTLYKLRQKSDEDIFMRGDSSLRNETLVIYLLKKAVEYGDQYHFDDTEFQGLAAYLKHKISGYGFNGSAAYYAEATTASGGGAVETPALSGSQLFAQLVVGTGVAPDAGATSYTNTNLIGRYIKVVLDGLILSVGLADRQSYTYNISTGVITFTQELWEGQVIQIHTYIPTLAGWTLFDAFTTETAFTEYQDLTLLGKSVAVVVDGAIVPISLDDMFSYSYSSLTGTITFTGEIAIGQAVKIYTY